MRYFILLFLTTVSLTSLDAQSWWNRETVRGNGDVTVENRDVDEFRGVKACCNLEVEVTPGKNHSVQVEAESNLQDYIEVKSFGRTLEIGFKDGTNVKSTRQIVVYVTTPVLEELDASSSADIYTTGQFEGERLRLESSSGSSIKAMYQGRDVLADVSSGGKIEVQGAAEFFEGEASSGGQVRAENLTAKEVDADVSSGGGIEINVSEKLKADASSGGKVRYSGNPESVNVDSSSGGSVRKR